MHREAREAIRQEILAEVRESMEQDEAARKRTSSREEVASLELEAGVSTADWAWANLQVGCRLHRTR